MTSHGQDPPTGCAGVDVELGIGDRIFDYVGLTPQGTGAGMIGGGEGVFSLARPFLEAGASTVVATLWDIPDKSAALLFEEFHRGLTGGQTPAVALSHVQRQFVHHSDVRLRPPAHWAWAVPIGALD